MEDYFHYFAWNSGAPALGGLLDFATVLTPLLRHWLFDDERYTEYFISLPARCWWRKCCFQRHLHRVQEKVSQNVFVISSAKLGRLWQKL